MLGNSRLMTAIPVRNLDRARAFYEGVLGLEFAGGPRADGSLEYQCGGGTGLFTYPTEENAGKSPATLAAWQVYDIEATANGLRDKDVALEDYDMPGLKTEHGIATLPGGKAIWFKDPDGNILNVFERE
jgi:catechol 2,3-dioxygenase-like lactoylglutathione lyase family enzyme